MFSPTVSECARHNQDYEWTAIGRNKIVVDSEASVHKICDLMLRSIVPQVPRVQIELPDGSKIESHQQGKLPL